VGLPRKLFATLMATRLDIDDLSTLLAPLREPFRIQLIILFGSSVTGLRGPESDLDLAFLGDAPLDLIAVTTDVIRSLHTDRVDVVDLRRASPLLAMEVARHGRLVYERQPGTHLEFISLAVRRYIDTKKLRDAQKDAIHRFLTDRGLA
jgi:predicted nucleotidyltransferase